MIRIKIGPIDLYGCREALELMDDYIDRELPVPENKKVAIHLKICRVCASKFDFESLFINEVRAKMNAVEIPSQVEKGVRIALDKERT